MNDLPENELAIRAGHGDTDAADALVRMYEPRNRGLVRRSTTTESPEYDEALQRVRIATWLASYSYDPARGTFDAYARRTRRFRSWSRGVHRDVGDGLDEGVEVFGCKNLTTEVESADIARRMREAVRGCAALDLKDRCIYTECILGERTHRDVGRQLGIDAKTVWRRAERIRSMLPGLFAHLR